MLEFWIKRGDYDVNVEDKVIYSQVSVMLGYSNKIQSHYTVVGLVQFGGLVYFCVGMDYS